MAVKADDLKGGTDTVEVTIGVTDADEKPARPGRPAVDATPDTSDSLDVLWSEPDLNGGPDLTGYKLRYAIEDTLEWSETTPTGTSHTIGGLETATTYEVQVRALNGETPSDWSQSGRGTVGVEAAGRGDVRLFGGSTAHEGRLEVFYRGEWGSVCDDRFDRPFVDPSSGDDTEVPNVAADVACQLLDEGYVSGEMVTRQSLGIPRAPESQPTWLDDVRCAEGSTHWTDPPKTPFDVPGRGLHRCYHAGVGLHNCARSHAEDVYLECSAGETPQGVVSGKWLTLRYRQPLDPVSTPGAKDWVVRGASAAGARTVPVVGWRCRAGRRCWSSPRRWRRRRKWT